MDREQIKLLKFALSFTQDWTDDFITTVAKISDLSERTVREWYLDELEVSCVIFVICLVFVVSIYLSGNYAL